MTRVLIVEDDSDILSSLVEVVREEGFEVTSAANGYQALAAVEVTPPDVIFLDLCMPQLDGERFLELLRQRFPSLAAEVVLISALPEVDEVAARMGIRWVLRKPFLLTEVARIARECAARPAR